MKLKYQNILTTLLQNLVISFEKVRLSLHHFEITCKLIVLYSKYEVNHNILSRYHINTRKTLIKLFYIKPIVLSCSSYIFFEIVMFGSYRKKLLYDLIFLRNFIRFMRLKSCVLYRLRGNGANYLKVYTKAIQQSRSLTFALAAVFMIMRS